MNKNDIILTGLPRSGTTLVCHLLNKLENTVALHEPMRVNFSEEQFPDQICHQIKRFFETTRHSILTSGTAHSLHIKNQIPDNHMSNHLDDSGLRIKVAGVERGTIKIEKTLQQDFNLCIKHNAVFTLLLEPLLQKFDCYAIIRNPLSLLASWNSVKLPINNGHIPMAEKQNQELAKKLNAIPDKVERQITIMSWFFNQFNQVPKSHIIRYEDLISSGGSSLEPVVINASQLKEPLKSKNKNKLYDQELMKTLGEKLLNSKGHHWDYYQPKDIHNLLKKLD